ncbi:hypothetical protein SAMN05880582_10181 [Rhizobium sp. RU20A]|uniref:DUF2000 family protein n=1 Tax=Rhizobium sp. RU20A TaxID=1907412 RepID=UPI0009563D2D|nr:DUF2000 family protein [Rhizobium sp. RU20A]SIP93616.1 hypothetical protein SAMN05880582_10181 [Rhizobium sp. RU20A]
MFDTKVAIVVRYDLAVWQKLNVTAFLMSGLVAQSPEMIGQAYRDAAGGVYNAMSRQPVVVLAAELDLLRTIQTRAETRGVITSSYIEEMFETGHDDANRAVFARFTPQTARLVGIALHAERKIIDKITKGAKMHA